MTKKEKKTQKKITPKKLIDKKCNMK